MLRKIGFLAVVMAAFFVASPANASKCYVKEYRASGTSATGVIEVAAEPAIVDQTAVDFTAGHAESAAFNAQTRYVRIWCDAQASFKIDFSPIATNAMSPLAASAPEYFSVQPGMKLSVVANP